MKEYTGYLYKKDPNTSIDFQEEAYMQKPLLMKVMKTLPEINGNKATGVDELPIEPIKAADIAAITALTTLCQQIWKSNLWPQEWRKSLFSPLPKKKETLDCVPITQTLH